MASVQIRNVSKRFGNVVAVAGTSFDLTDGESLVILGPSGSGKSTLLRLIAGLEDADGGDIFIRGVQQATLPAHKRDIAIVFQNFALYPHLSAKDNITLGLRHGIGLSKQQAAARATEIAERLGISELLPRLPKQMSGGQRQRVALARALARQAGVVLLDEPLSGLDAQLRMVLRAEIAEIMRSTGATTIHVTHDQTDAMAMADRVAVIRDGCIEQLGTPHEVYDTPATLFVAQFIGVPPMNIMDGTLVAASRWETPFSHLDLPDLDSGGSHLSLGIRPEAIKTDPFGSADFELPADVVLVEHEGASSILHVHTTSTSLPRTTLRARIPAKTTLKPGDTTTIGLDESDIHLFDAHGDRIGTLDAFKRKEPQRA